MKDEYTRNWIIENGVPIVKDYDGEITLRALHYRLVALGMTNSIQHYKRVIGAMTKARWEGLISFNAFVDHDRSVEGETQAKIISLYDEVNIAKEQIELWMKSYHRNRWENQYYYPEVFIEKKALQGVFAKPCDKANVALCPCKGYPSLTYLDLAASRFIEAMERGQHPIILYFGDYDPSGEDIPRSIADILDRMGVTVPVERIALKEQQVLDWKLPPAPKKVGDSRSANWDGLGQVELDAVEPRKLRRMVADAINEYFDVNLYKDLLEKERGEREIYQKELKTFVNEIK